MSNEGEALLQPPFKQCALVVEDLDEAVRRWNDDLGIGPWTAFRLEPPGLKEMYYRGAEVSFSLRHALAWQGEVQFELVQPLSGPSIWADHLAEHGPGMHHIGKYVSDHAAAVAAAVGGWLLAVAERSRLRCRRRWRLRLFRATGSCGGH